MVLWATQGPQEQSQFGVSQFPGRFWTQQRRLGRPRGGFSGRPKCVVDGLKDTISRGQAYLENHTKRDSHHLKGFIIQKGQNFHSFEPKGNQRSDLTCCANLAYPCCSKAVV